MDGIDGNYEMLCDKNQNVPYEDRMHKYDNKQCTRAPITFDMVR